MPVHTRLCRPVDFISAWSRGGSRISISFFPPSIWSVSPDRNSAYRFKSASPVLEAMWMLVVEGSRFESLSWGWRFPYLLSIQSLATAVPNVSKSMHGLYGPKRHNLPSVRVGNGTSLAPQGMGVLMFIIIFAFHMESQLILQFLAPLLTSSPADVPDVSMPFQWQG